MAPVDVSDYEREAKLRIAPMAWEYIAGGAADEITLRWDRESYDRLRLRPRVLVDVSKIDTRVSLCGAELPFPILLAPTAFHRLAHPEGELASVRGAGAAKAVMVLSTYSTCPVAEVAAAATAPTWFQLYSQPDRGHTRELVRRAEAAGCSVLVLTVDTPVRGPRYREARSQFALPEGLDHANFRGIVKSTQLICDPALSWKDVEWIRSITRLPVVLKGVMNPEDAAQAAAEGLAAVIVSSHGARNLDTVPATIDALPEVAAKVAGRIPVLVDGGIRRGTDVLKALALGASAVLVGRPYLYGLAVGGAEGVAHVVNILRKEFEMAMAMTGRRSIAEIDASVIWRSPHFQ